MYLYETTSGSFSYTPVKESSKLIPEIGGVMYLLISRYIEFMCH